uniref:Uncharacterized protein n=1 Tax=Arundo donax TaxID=35708 RepID=A0A0A9BJ66_ARUDO
MTEERGRRVRQRKEKDTITNLMHGEPLNNARHRWFPAL